MKNGNTGKVKFWGNEWEREAIQGDQEEEEIQRHWGKNPTEENGRVRADTEKQQKVNRAELMSRHKDKEMGLHS